MPGILRLPLLCLLALTLVISACEDDPSEDVPAGGGGDQDFEEDAEDEGCTPPGPVALDEPDLDLKKFALSMFHYNIQYVAGGFIAEDDGKIYRFWGGSSDEWDDERLQDWIILESFEPVLDFYIAHPGWRVTFEMQGMMLEAIGERFPAILVKLRDAAKAGTVEIVSFHYSAQLFLAFPTFDLERSIEITREIFDLYCVPLSGVVFNQEGQAGEGRHAFMAGHGYSISVFPKNLYNYVRYEEPRGPYYKDHGVDVIIGPGGVDADSGIDVNWVFFDDGELLTTPFDPYFAISSEADYEELAKYEEKLLALEADGYKITSITDYVNHLKAQGVEQPALPPVIDGTWQATSTDSVLRWLGGRSLAPYNAHERDSLIRSGNYRARTELRAAEILLDTAVAKAVSVPAGLGNDIDYHWRRVFEAEVSDATGITPWIGEYLYADQRNEEVLAFAEAAQEDLKTALGWEFALIDFREGSAEKSEAIFPEAPDPCEAPIEITVAAPTRDVEVLWNTYGNETYFLDVTYGPSGDPSGNTAEDARVAVQFPRSEDMIRYSPALMEESIVEYAFGDFNFQRGEIYLPLANGLIGLGGGWWVVKCCRSVHLAARVALSDEEKIIEFIDETADPANSRTMRFIVYYGEAGEALDIALGENIHPAPFVR